MKRAAIAIVLFISATAFAGGHYMDNKKTITHDCAKDPDVMVMGNENTVTTTGKCNLVQLSGNKNTLTSDSVTGLSVTGNDNTASVGTVDKISATGSRNTVGYKKTAGDKATVSNTGKDNKITQTK